MSRIEEPGGERWADGGRPAEIEDPFERVLETSFSRNRHFAWYQAQPGAVRSFRRLVHGLLADLEHAGPHARIDVEHDLDGRRFWLSIDIPRYRLQHRCRLAEQELRALRRHPEIGHRLAITDDVS